MILWFCQLGTLLSSLTCSISTMLQKSLLNGVLETSHGSGECFFSLISDPLDLPAFTGDRLCTKS